VSTTSDLSQDLSRLLPDEQRNLYIDGTWREAGGGERL
jgi:hypothetical protein